MRVRRFPLLRIGEAHHQVEGATAQTTWLGAKLRLQRQTARRNRKAKMWGSPSARTEDERHKDLYTAGKVVNAGSVGGRQVSHSSSLFARRSTWRARVVWESLGTLISDIRLNDLVRPALVGAVPAVVASAWWCTQPQRLMLVVQLLPLFPLSLPPFLSLFLLARSCLHLQSARRRCRDVRRVLTNMRQVWLGQDRGIPTTPGSTERAAAAKTQGGIPT